MTDTAAAPEQPGPIDNSAMQPDIAAQRARDAANATPAAQKPPQDAAAKPPAGNGSDAADEQNGPEGSAASESGDAPAPARKGPGKRIDELTKNWRDTERERDAARREAEELRQRLESLEQSRKPATNDDADRTQRNEVDPNRRPTLEDFNFDHEAYTEAVADWRFEQRERQREEATRQQEREKVATERRAAFEEANPDYQEVVSNPNLPITKDMAEAMFDTDQPEALAYYLGKNPDEAAKIAQLSPRQQVIAIGRLEAKLSAPAAESAAPSTPPPPPVPVSKAPAPPPKLKPTASASTPLEEMSMAEYVATRDNQEKAKRAR